jgi:ribose transport system ATP-binding protein
VSATSNKTAPGMPPALSFQHLSKRFGGVTALDDVSLEVAPGEVHGLLGQNGSGKSTLIRILAGFHAPEPGARLAIHGQNVRLPIAPGTALRLGIAFVHQHLALAPSLSVLQNLRIEQFATRTQWRIDWRTERRRARETFRRFGLTIDPDDRISDLPQVERALVAIVRAFEDIAANTHRDRPGLLVLDEPTPFLPRAGVDQLFTLVRNIATHGTSVIFVSHDVEEVLEITDRATILRDGKVAGSLVTREATAEQFVEIIVGRQLRRFRSERRDLSALPLSARISALSGGTVRDVSVELRCGEIVGLTGLIGSGFDEVPYLVFGAKPANSGTVEIDARHYAASQLSPSVAITARIALLPADRLTAAGVGALSVAHNISLPVLARFFRAGRLQWPRIMARAAELCDAYEVRPNRPELKLGSLSGGNQQKVVMIKWLQTRPRVLLLHEPTQGVDVGARQALFAALHEAARGGTGVLCASTDYEELAQICDRVLIFARGQIVRELRGAELSKESIAEHCLRSVSLAGFVTRAAA